MPRLFKKVFKAGQAFMFLNCCVLACSISSKSNENVNKIGRDDMKSPFSASIPSFKLFIDSKQQQKNIRNKKDLT